MSENSIQTTIWFAQLTLVASWLYAGAVMLDKLPIPEWMANILFIIVVISAFYLFFKLAEIRDMALYSEHAERQTAQWENRYLLLSKYCAELERKLNEDKNK